MKLVAILTIFLLYAMVKAMILSDDPETEIDLPAFEEPDQEIDDIPGGCGGFTDCIEFLGEVITGFVQAIIYVVQLIINLVTYFIEFLIFIVTATFTGVDGAPAWLNFILTVGPALGLAIIVFKAFRKGDTDA